MAEFENVTAFLMYSAVSARYMEKISSGASLAEVARGSWSPGKIPDFFRGNLSGKRQPACGQPELRADTRSGKILRPGLGRSHGARGEPRR
jgi:hypothetical protein